MFRGCYRGCGSRAAVASILRSAGVTGGSSKKDGSLGEEWKSPGARAGSFGGLVERGGGCSTWGRGNWPHSGRSSAPFEAVQLANITWDTFFAFLGASAADSECSFPSFPDDSHAVFVGSPVRDSGYITDSWNCVR